MSSFFPYKKSNIRNFFLLKGAVAGIVIAVLIVSIIIGIIIGANKTKILDKIRSNKALNVFKFDNPIYKRGEI